MRTTKSGLRLLVVQILVVVALIGFLAAFLIPAGRYRRSSQSSGQVASADASSNLAQFGLTTKAHHDARFAKSEMQPGDALPGAQSVSPATDRKIIYTASVELAVEDFADVGNKVVELVARYGGYVADSRVSGTSGESRQAMWKVRVPIARFDEFVRDAKGLGELASASTNSQDVSEEYYDVDARIRNKTKEEERLLKLLEERPGKLEDVIAIERELSRVREELERMQGRMRVLADQTSLTSVQLVVREVHGYRPAEAPTFLTRIGRSFDDSLTALGGTAEALAVGIVALVPWLALVALAALGTYPVWRVLLRRWQPPTSPVI